MKRKEFNKLFIEQFKIKNKHNLTLKDIFKNGELKNFNAKKEEGTNTINNNTKQKAKH